MKTEKEKMLAGLPYQAFGEELLAERQYAKQLSPWLVSHQTQCPTSHGVRLPVAV
jgi:hypothetical protein